MAKDRCLKVFKSLKKASRKFKVKNFSKKHGLRKFYSLAARSGSKKNKGVYKALKSASKSVRPYKRYSKQGLRTFFSNASRKYKGKKCKKVFSALKKSSNKTKRGLVTRKALLKFYNRAEKIYKKSLKHKSRRHKSKKY